MTTLTTPARPGEDANLRPVPWRRMAWVTWRQHRFALAGVAVFLGAWAVYLWLTGLQQHHDWAAAIACHPASSLACRNMKTVFHSTYGGWTEQVAVLLQPVPGLIGAFTGAPVLARELETGTFRYAWTQGFGRWRWILAKLVPLAVVVAVATGAFSLLVSWCFQLVLVGGNSLSPEFFDLRGVAFAAWTLAAFSIGALAGMLIRRVVPAIAATLAAWAGLAYFGGRSLLQHYLAPLVTSNLNLNAATIGWDITQWWTKDGTTVSQSTINQVLAASGAQQYQNATQYLAQHGYTQWMSYQPASRFWAFQWIEGGWLLALSLLLITATVWLVRRRAA